MPTWRNRCFISHALLKRLNLPRRRQSQELKIETIQGKPLGRGHIKYRSTPVSLQVGCFHRETISFLVLEGPTVDIILGRPGSPTIHQKSDGTPVRSSGGVRRASRIVSPMFLHLQQEPPVFKSTPPSWRASNSRKAPRSHLTTQRSRMYSANRQPPNSAPLTSMLRRKPKSLSWNPEAQAALKRLKETFCTTPILTHPDPQLPFVIEVDASTTSVGAVLSQHHGEPPRLHPCAYFSKKLTPAEQNYDIGNRELLAIKLALEEWRHWLEGAQHPFEVITDHKNLEYIRSAKRLNPRQARWALFFTRFLFTITYRPGRQERQGGFPLSHPFSRGSSCL